MISSPPFILGCVTEKLSIQKCVSTEFGSEIFLKEILCTVSSISVSKTEYLGSALCMYFLFRTFKAI